MLSKPILVTSHKYEALNGAINEALTDNQKMLLDMLRNDPTITQKNQVSKLDSALLVSRYPKIDMQSDKRNSAGRFFCPALLSILYYSF
ncbi:hypothetical protein [Laedolimicola intestinihominis]|uniref:Uncharacterized protein n=1 Tax=Laedolimicola intestinihominis TaxID=3133166 RepID=A0ABV1FC70_9FIRM